MDYPTLTCRVSALAVCGEGRDRRGHSWMVVVVFAVIALVIFVITIFLLRWQLLSINSTIILILFFIFHLASSFLIFLDLSSSF